jgi:hypothetical protein
VTPHAGSPSVDVSAPLASLTIPWGRQQITLHEVAFEAGGARLLRVRIREGHRFTVFDIDAASARRWAEAMGSWADAQPGGGE